MLTSIKSFYGKLCVLLATGVWVAYLGQQVLAILLIFVPGNAGRPIGSVLLVALILAAAWKVWPKVAHLAVEEVVNSKKATVGIFLLTLALVAFPGTVLLPLAYAAWSGHSEAKLLGWYALFGIPFFVVFSIIGLILTFGSRPQRVA